MNKASLELIKFYLNNQIFKAKRIKKDEKLSKVRQLLGLDLPEKSFFILSDGTFVEKEDEFNIELSDILDNNNIYLIKNENDDIINDNPFNTISCIKNNDDFPLWLNSQDKTEEIKEKEKEKESINNIKKKEKDEVINYHLNKKKCKIFRPPIKYSSLKLNIYLSKENKLNEDYFIQNKDNANRVGRKIPSISSCKKIEKLNNLDIYLYPKFHFHDFEESKALSFMVVGETGSGKTTLLNSFVNFLLGVNINDQYRYKIILEKTNKSQANSQTDQANIYNIRSVGGYPPIKIIDTPGFGDTEGIEKDNEITEQIEKLFKESINEINAICFVTKSTNNRLTVSQKYILNKILDMFGENMRENFIFILTFCDGGLPNIVEQLKSKDCPFQEIIESTKDWKWYFKFNNSSFYESDREDEYTEIFWKLGIKNFEDFLSRLKCLPKKNLNLTKEVLKERKLLEEKVNILVDKLKDGINKVNELKEIIKIIIDIKKDINISKIYVKKTKIPIIERIDKNPNFYATTCLICNKTCHSTCEIADDDQKQKCTSMDQNGYCMVCPKKCKWDQHKNRNYILQEVFEEKEIILEDLKKRYFDNINELSIKEKIFITKKEELMIINSECIEIQEIICLSIKKLKKIALKKTAESEEEFFDMLIEVEKSEHNSGWQNRIRNLEKIKEQKKILKEIYIGTNIQMNQIRDFILNELYHFIENEIQ